MLEVMEHEASCFITLTYNDEHLPNPPEISKRELQLFLKRLRKAIYPRSFRYYCVGEYGDKSHRPHYHGILFGIGPTEEEVIGKCWGKGFVQVGTAEVDSARYVAGYVLKKMTKSGDTRLMGRPPEFAIMSRKPGIGIGCISRFAAAYDSSSGKAALLAQGWSTSEVRIGGSRYPLGYYLKGKLEKTLGFSEMQKRQHTTQVWEERSREDRHKSRAERMREYWAKVNQQKKIRKERTL